MNTLLKKVHPEGIPWPLCLLYNMLSQSSIFRKHYRLVAEDVKHYCRQGRLLDIGTGPGWLLASIRQTAPLLDLTGVDISEAMVKKAIANLKNLPGCHEKIDFKTAPADILPYDDENFDIVISTGSIHHWKKPVAGLNEIYRVLKKDGYALIYDIVKKYPKDVENRIKKEFGAFRWTLLCLHSFEEPFYDEDELRALALSSAFGKGTTQFIGCLCCLVLKKE